VDRVFISLAALSGCLAVAFGAFGAHALKDRLSGDMLQVFQTGVSYQMYHALALLAVGVLLARFSSQGSTLLSAAGWLFVAGSVLFSGSLYLLSLTGTTWLGAITPLGGVAFLLGWLALAVGVWSK
jgi:uncharacterized membrane protein YgdD (TMEM256/DUF423 family)